MAHDTPPDLQELRHIATCEMFCTRPLDAGSNPGTPQRRAMCSLCRPLFRLACRDVLPAIRRSGYWAPVGSTIEAELAAMIEQGGLRDELHASLSELLGDDAAGQIMGMGGDLR